MRLKQVLPVVMLFSVLFGSVFAEQTLAADYDVNAKVSAAIASQPAVILQPLTGAAFNSEQITVSGACQITTPSQLVIITRNGSFAGSGACSVVGEFSIEITLVLGGNQLIARIRNVTNDFGPNGPTVQVNYSIPSEEEPAGTQDDAATPSDLETTVQDSSTTSSEDDSSSVSKLKLTTEDQVIIFRPNGEVSIAIHIEEGASPYDVFVNWGDETSQRFSSDTAGKKVLKHVYKSPGDKSIKIAVTDESGKTVQLTLGAVSTNLPIDTGEHKAALPPLVEQVASYKGAVAAGTMIAAGAAAVVVISNSVAGLSSSSIKTKSKGVKRGKK